MGSTRRNGAPQQVAGRGKFWRLAAAQLLIVVGSVAVLFYFRTTALLAGPPSGDLYANNWGFQLVVFFAVLFPATLLIVDSIIAIERAVMIHHSVEKNTDSAP